MKNEQEVFNFGPGLIAITIFLIVIIFLGYSAIFAGESSFCRRQGYNYKSLYGTYLPYKGEDYGRITCTKYFVEGREEQHFNVTKNWLGVYSLYNGK